MTADLKPHPESRERELFLEALEKGDARERSAFLDEACGANQDLRRKVDELIRQTDGGGDFLEKPAMAPATAAEAKAHSPSGTALAAVATEKIGDRIGRYKLLQRLGEGGCGTVYMAEQEEPVRRRVALKIIKLGMDTRQV